MLSKFLDPKNDVAFRKIFGSEKNKDILIHFLNDMITFKEHGRIQEVTFLKTTQDPEIAAQKTSIVDILCKDEKGNTYIVEMQVAKEKGFVKRAQFYASKAYISQTHSGGSYHDLKEVIFLAIADFVMFPNNPDYKSDHVTLERKNHTNDLKDFSYTFIELPKFKLGINDLKSILEKWCYFFKHAEETSESDLKRLIGHDQIIERAYQELNRFSWNEQELLTYDQAEKYAWSYQASMEQKFDEGIAKGRVEGIAKGKVEGIVAGRVEGRVEGIVAGRVEGEKEALLKVAKMMKLQGISITTVTLITGLSKADIESS